MASQLNKVRIDAWNYCHDFKVWIDDVEISGIRDVKLHLNYKEVGEIEVTLVADNLNIGIHKENQDA